jgi:hypothetical protein
MSQRPTGAEAVARVAITRAVHDAVIAQLDKDAKAAGASARLFFASLPLKYRDREHSVLGTVDVDEVLGLRTHRAQRAVDWARHWLGPRGFAEVMTLEKLVAQQDRGMWVKGCPRVWEVPRALHYRHLSGAQIIVWASGEMDAYTDAAHTKRKQTSATPETLEEGYGQWTETFFDHTGRELNRSEVAAICAEAGVL